MKNIYFPDEDITYNDLYFVCYMIERVARYLHQPDRYVVGGIGRSELERLLSIANVQHCENPLKIRDEWIEEYALERGDFDVSDVDESMETRVPTDLQMGKVYARLITDTLQPGEDYADGIMRIYNAEVCRRLDDYDTGYYYEPSYFIAREYLHDELPGYIPA